MTTTAPAALRVEHLDTPLGIDAAAPRLSWRPPDGVTTQRAYRLRSDNGWDTGWVESERTLLVPYAGPPLGSAHRVSWQVRVRTDDGESPWSERSWFETGLLRPEDWTAEWIEPGRDPDGRPGERAAALLRVAFEVQRPVVAARLYATAHGLYEAFLDGRRLGDAELTPGFTQYDAHLQVQTVDAGVVEQGQHVLAAVLSDGWFRGQIGITRAADQWGDRLAFLAQLRLVHDDGSTSSVGTGSAWRSALGHVVAADLVAGQRVDLRRLPRGWDRQGFDDNGWEAVTVADHGYGGLVASPAPPVRRVEEITPVSVTRLDPCRQIIDLGQNINGWLRLEHLGPAGTTITLTHGEWLGPDGDVTTEHLRPAVPFLPEPLPAGQVDSVVSAGAPGDVFEPRHTTHGFQYVRVEGHPADLTPDDVRGIVVHTDLPRTGWFSCSDERINRFHEAAVWSLRGNACDVPTDCPHRERAGWTGDWQLYVATAAFLYDVAGFSAKWLRDVVADQWPDGTIANISPTARAEGRDSPVAFLNGSAGWGDAIVIVPWELYRAYGDTRILAETWPAMVAWLDRAERIARTQRHPDRAARRPVPAPHERYLWDAGFHWGEWLEPAGAPKDFPAFVAADKGDVATAYLAHSARLMSRIASALDRTDDEARYGELADRARDAWRAEYLDPQGRLTPDAQANHVRALAFDLVPGDLRAAVADRLVALIRAADGHLATGFLATPLLLPVLADTGHLDVAYDLLRQDTEPAWLVMTDRGATTTWERWNGVNDKGVPHESLNHYSKGAVISFLHRYTAGIDLLDDGPAYRRFRVRPRPGGGLTAADAAHDSPYGRIGSSWRVDGDQWEFRVVVPPGTSAELILPGTAPMSVGPGQHVHRIPVQIPAQSPAQRKEHTR